ncbi:MAG: T9SS type A sorting domain-containing protein [Saprospiraceae bacterium]|nr:MAG: T9SS type A sorting domain-containing protein [Saprospiraceae bacterium]
MKKSLHLQFFFLPLLLVLALKVQAQEYRTIDGTGNNLIHPEWGAVGMHIINGTPGFSDGISAPAGPDWPNPRFVSNALFAQSTLTNDSRGLSAYTWVWGQFIDHDLTLSPNHPSEVMNIAVPPYDAYFDPTGTGTVTIPMNRSDYDPATGTGINNPRTYYNGITAFVDASTIYGSDAPRAAWLRTFSGGKLKMSAGNLLPYNTTTGEYDAPVDPGAPGMAMPFPNVLKYFVSGDVRANENPFLAGLHTLFAREHNRLCNELAVQHPEWTDEQLYQQARKLVGAEIQAIIYEEWLPVLGMEVTPYSGYDHFVNPGILNVFNTAAYRYGHTTITSLMVRMDNNGEYMPQGDILLRNAFFNPTAITEVGGIEPYLIGMATVVQQDFDCKIIDDLRNFLFGQPGSGGLDLVATNINRGRDRGLPDYNTVRTDFGLPALQNFSEFSSDPLMNENLEFVYGDINKIDPWVGMLAENHMPDALFGKTAMTIVKKQFMDLRDGDRFYYENDYWLTEEEKQWIKNTRLSDVIRRNAPVTIIQDDIFVAEPFLTGVFERKTNEEIAFGLYPNPVHQQMSLRIGVVQKQEATLQIADGQGKVVVDRALRLSPGNNIVSLSLPGDLPAGYYVATIVAGGRTGSQSFIKQ